MNDDLLSVGDIARELKSNRDKVDYLIRSRGILPAKRMGKYRLFTPDVIGQLQAINQHKNNTRLCTR